MTTYTHEQDREAEEYNNSSRCYIYNTCEVRTANKILARSNTHHYLPSELDTITSLSRYCPS